MKIWFLLNDAHKCSFLPKAPWNMNYSSKLLENAVSSSKQPKFLFSSTQSKIWFPPQNQTENMKSQSNLKMQFAPQSNLEIWFSLRCNIKPIWISHQGNMKIWFSPECNFVFLLKVWRCGFHLKILKTTWKSRAVSSSKQPKNVIFFWKQTKNLIFS